MFLRAHGDRGQRRESFGNAATFYDAQCKDKDIRQQKWFGLLAASVGPVTKSLPSSLALWTLFMRKVALDGFSAHPLLVSVSSPLVSEVSSLYGLCDGPCFRLSRTSFSSVKIQTYNVHKIRKPINQIEKKYSHYSKLETTTGFSLLRKQSSTWLLSDDQWHDWKWQQDRWLTDIKCKIVVKNLESTRNSTSLYLNWTQQLPLSNACLHNFRVQSRLWTASQTSYWGPS